MLKSFFFYFLLLSYILITLTHKLSEFGGIPNDPSYPTVILNGQAFEMAIKTANSSQFDRIVLIDSNETYHMLPSGVQFGLSDIIIHIDGKIIAWEGDISQWTREEKSNSTISLISFTDSKNITFSGKGVIEGLGYRWWWDVILGSHDNRPNLLEMENAVDTKIQGLTFSNSPKYQVNLRNMKNVLVENITIFVDVLGQRAYLEKFGLLYQNFIPTFPLNTDGIDISGIDVIIRNSSFINFDDAVAVKPIHEGQFSLANCTQNITIENCYVKYGVGMSMGSVPPHTGMNCIKDVTIRNIEFDTPIKAIYIKSNPGTTGTGLISNILYEKIKITGALWWAIWIGPQQQHQPDGSSTGCSFIYPMLFSKCPTNPLVTIENIVLRDVNITGGVFSPGIILCNATNTCKNVVFEKVLVKDWSIVPYINGIHCENVQGTSIDSNLVPDCFNKY